VRAHQGKIALVDFVLVRFSFVKEEGR